MVQNSADAGEPSEPRRRGRPRAYNPDVALSRAMEAFWKGGYAGTSLDDLSAATGMNRPSLYAAFGDKRDIFVQAYQKYRARMRDEFGPRVQSPGPLRETLRGVFEAAAELYLSGPDGPRGCLTVITAASEAVAEPEIGPLVVEAIASLDLTFEALFAKARARGELAAAADPAALGRAATAIIHSLAIRARAKCPANDLQTLLEDALMLLCGEPRRRRSS